MYTFAKPILANENVLYPYLCLRLEDATGNALTSIYKKTAAYAIQVGPVQMRIDATCPQKSSQKVKHVKTVHELSDINCGNSNNSNPATKFC